MEEFLHPSDDLNEPLPPESQALLDRFKAYAVWHPRLLQVRTQVLDTVWEPADVVFVVVCGPSGVGKSKLAEVLTNRLNTPKPELKAKSQTGTPDQYSPPRWRIVPPHQFLSERADTPGKNHL